jgi:hypothetical protein
VSRRQPNEWLHLTGIWEILGMQKRQIRITACSIPYPHPAGWDELVRRTFEALGWTVTAYGHTTDGDELYLESENGTMEFSALKKVLTELGILHYDLPNYYYGDINGL